MYKIYIDMITDGYSYMYIFQIVLFKSPWFPNLFREEILEKLEADTPGEPSKGNWFPTKTDPWPWHLVPYKASTPSLERPKSVSTACASSSRTTFLIVKFFCDQRTKNIFCESGRWGKLRTAFRLEEISSQDQYWENDNLQYQKT